MPATMAERISKADLLALDHSKREWLLTYVIS